MRKLVLLLLIVLSVSAQVPDSRPRARDLGIKIGVLPQGPLDAITDVAGVKVGHITIIQGDNVRTGVTAILPHDGNLFKEKVPGAVFVGNAFGKLIGSTQVNELGEIETPILLTQRSPRPKLPMHLSATCSGSKAMRTCNQSTRWSARLMTATSTIFARALSPNRMC